MKPLVLPIALLSCFLSAAGAFAVEFDCQLQSLTPFRDQWAAEFQSQSASYSSLSKKCFPAAIPACLQNLSAVSDNLNALPSQSYDAQAKDDERKQPPAELIQSKDPSGIVRLVPNVEQVAKAKGWPVVRYKSRHSGGFDTDTPSLMMIRVPGKKLNPPVNFDRYLNFPIPADDAAEAMNPIPQKNPVLSPEELAAPGNFPKQFTIVTLTHAEEGKPAEVVFQKYGRSGTQWNPDSPAGVVGCYQCHPNGLRAISPLGYHVRQLEDGKTERQMPMAEWLKVQEMNESMEAFTGGKLVSWRGATKDGVYRKFFEPTGLGPIVGLSSPLTKVTIPREGVEPLTLNVTRQKEFIMGGKIGDVTYPGCFNSRGTISVRDIFNRPPGANAPTTNVFTLTPNPPIQWQHVRDAMNCASCHGNSRRGAFNAAVDFRQIDFKILVDQAMPLGFHQDPMDFGSPDAPVQDALNPNERIALANCLKVEFENYESSKMKEWLTSVSCDARPAGGIRK